MWKKYWHEFMHVYYDRIWPDIFLYCLLHFNDLLPVSRVCVCVFENAIPLILTFLLCASQWMYKWACRWYFRFDCRASEVSGSAESKMAEGKRARLYRLSWPRMQILMRARGALKSVRTWKESDSRSRIICFFRWFILIYRPARRRLREGTGGA